MEAFAELLDRLVYTTARNSKIKLLADYFKPTPDPDRRLGARSITDGLPLRLPMRRTLQILLDPRVDPELFRLSRDYVGDTAETVSLLWPDGARTEPAPSIGEVVDTIKGSSLRSFPSVLEGFLDRLDVKQRFALIKLLSGAMRVGAPLALPRQRLPTCPASTSGGGGGLARHRAALWRSLRLVRRLGRVRSWCPRAVPARHASASDRRRRLEVRSRRGSRRNGNGTAFACSSRPGMDGCASSRAPAMISGTFPDLVQAFAHCDGVLDGELLVLREGVVAPFNDLQQRLNRKDRHGKVTAGFSRPYPGFTTSCSMAWEDLRSLPLSNERAARSLV